METSQNFFHRYDAMRGNLSPGYQRVGDYLVGNYRQAAFQTAAQVAAAVDLDTTSVVRFAQRLDYRGYPQMQADIVSLVLIELESIPTGGWGSLDPIFRGIAIALARAERIHPDWPRALLAQGAIVVEEGLEMTQEAITYLVNFQRLLNDIEIQGDDTEANRRALVEECFHLGAMVVRFLRRYGGV